MKYEPDIFYDINSLPATTVLDILTEAKTICKEWWADILDCSKSFARQEIDLSFEDIMSRTDDNALFLFIHRRGYENWKDNEFFPHSWCLETGFRTMSTPDYFLWIVVDENKIQHFVDKYKIKLLT